MKIALIGYGKMGKTIEKVARERGHEIVSVIDVNNPEEFESAAFRSADVAIEFTAPAVAVENYRRAMEAGVAVVSGTTGWHEQMPEVMEMVGKSHGTFFWASNFSLGVKLFSILNNHLAKLMNPFAEYEVEMTEVHHTQKRDAPSGTAITLAEGVIEHLDRKKGWVKEQAGKDGELAIKSLREGDVPGIHTIRYESDVDSIEISHSAKSREGFAVGAVVAAEFTAGKKGVLGMDDLFEALL